MSKTTPTAAESTEALLQGVIAECHAIIREQVRPAMASSEIAHERYNYVEAAVSLAKIAADLGKAVARLRVQPAPERRQRITVERIEAVRRLSSREGGGA